MMSPFESDMKTLSPAELLAGYRRFNAWENKEQMIKLPDLSVEAGLIQFFQLCSLAQQLAGEKDMFLTTQNKSYWMQQLATRQKAARSMGYARSTTSPSRS